jgi:asparaginyl-tRNA synthetase
LKALLEDTRDKKYSQFTMQHFGAWEEIRLTEIFGSSIILTQFPLLQIPFYHANAASEFEGIPLAENADVVLSGYRETIGSGVRLRDIGALMEKARVFNLPLADYEPYFQIRRMDGYRPSAGFGLGWQRLVQWILCLPFIWEATVFPRGHTIPHP